MQHNIFLFVDSVVDYLYRHGSLEGYYYEYEWEFYNMWELLSDEDKWQILVDAQFTGAIIPDEYLIFGTVLKPMPKEHFLGKYTYLKDSLGDADCPYSIRYEDGTIIWTPDLEPEQRIKSTGVLWVLGGSGLCEDVYYAKNKVAEDDLIIYAGAIFFKDGQIIKQ